MNKKNLKILELDEGATKEDIQFAYEKLRSKYLEERFSDGEKGNKAAKMLTEIEIAYNELMNELAESAAAEDSDSAFARVEEYIRDGNIQDAQRVLDSFNERGGRWHYLQSVVFYRKNWINESKKQLEIAIQLEPGNEKYKKAYKTLNDNMNNAARNANGGQTVYEGQTMNSAGDNQMGGNFCSNCIECCYINMCINCLCSMCCR